MEKCNNCNLCDNADQGLKKFLSELPAETSHHRVEGQSVKCGFGLQGICCRLCANGPCRITPEGPKGVCGADANTIVVRNFLRAVACGSGCYIHVVENTVSNLKDMALDGREFASPGALLRLARVLGIEEQETIAATAVAVADAIMGDLYKPEKIKMDLVEKLAYPKRYDVWNKLGILPGGAKSEVFEGVVKTSTNLSSDPVEMLLHCLKLGISTGLYGLLLTNLLNDIMVGEPKICMSSVGLHIIDPDYINVMVTGHQEAMFDQIAEEMQLDETQRLAESVGAKGFRIVGCTCVGQDMQQRLSRYGEVFAGNAGNNFTSEAVLATGAIDGVISEFNCTLPGIETLCDEYDIEQICLDPAAKKSNAELMQYNYETAKEDAALILMKIADKYCIRRRKTELNLFREHGNDHTVVGLTEVSLKKMLGGTWEPLLNLIVEGSIKGVACVVGCSSVAYGHDTLTVGLTRALLKKDILVLTAGCSSGALANSGLMMPEAAAEAGDSLRKVCESLGIPPVLNFGPCIAIGRLELVAKELAEVLGIDIPKLPIVLSAAQWLEEQALADGAFGLALGFTLHLGVPPFVTGSEVAVDVLTNQMEQLTGGKLLIQDDPKIAADMLEEVILEKRRALEI